jgi:hypothetical protein
MPGKANIGRRKRTERGSKIATRQQELKRRRETADEKEIAELEERSRIAE